MTGATRDNAGYRRDLAGPAPRLARTSGRLETWKEIGSFMSCDGRTAKRWEVTRGMPVHRIPGAGRSKVFAFADELTEWLTGAGPGTDPLEAPESSPATSSSDPRHGGAFLTAISKRWVAPAALGSLMIVLMAGVVALTHRPTAARAQGRPDVDAVEFYQAGLHNWNTRTPDGLHMAVDNFTQAIVRDPGYAEAYVGLANCYNLLREYTDMAPSEAYPRAKAAALRAIALDDRLAGGHLAYAFEQFYWEWNTSVADREFRRAIALAPTSAQAHHWYANFERERGKDGEALGEIERAQALDPMSTSILADKALILSFVGRQDDAITLLRGIERTSPTNLSAHAYLAGIYLDRNDEADYITEAKRAAELRQDTTGSTIAEAAERGWRAGGRPAMLRAILAAELDLRRRGLIANYAVAQTYARLDDDDDALSYLAASEAGHETDFTGVRRDNAFTALRRSPRFATVVRSLNA